MPVKFCVFAALQHSISFSLTYLVQYSCNIQACQTPDLMPLMEMKEANNITDLWYFQNCDFRKNLYGQQYNRLIEQFYFVISDKV